MNHEEIWILCLLLFFCYDTENLIVDHRPKSEYNQGCECGLKKNETFRRTETGPFIDCMKSAAFESADEVFR